jgi:hypothetical protein
MNELMHQTAAILTQAQELKPVRFTIKPVNNAV